jgi:hypothetical protein
VISLSAANKAIGVGRELGGVEVGEQPEGALHPGTPVMGAAGAAVEGELPGGSRSSNINSFDLARGGPRLAGRRGGVW